MTLGLGRVQVFVAPENVAALRLAERAGFRREGLLRSYWESRQVHAATCSILVARCPATR